MGGSLIIHNRNDEIELWDNTIYNSNKIITIISLLALRVMEIRAKIKNESIKFIIFSSVIIMIKINVAYNTF